MWHEARKQEKKIRGLMVDYKRRAERRREFYEKIKLDPAQFVRVFGQSCKINLDPAIAVAAESPQSMMPWQGDTSNMIDRFDVRAHLDIMPPEKSHTVHLTREEEDEERKANYERYRIIVENECAGLTEEQALQQLYFDELYGAINKDGEEEKSKLKEKKAAIGYVYEDSTKKEEEENEDSDSDESEKEDIETLDLDIALDIDSLTPDQMELLNVCGTQFGMGKDDFIKYLRRDKDESEALKMAKLLEEEKAQFAGRKSRRERRIYKEKRLAGRPLSPPSYAARDSPKYEPYRRSSSKSRSRSKTPPRKVRKMYITSFGENDDSDEGMGVVQGPQLPPPGLGTSKESEKKTEKTCERKKTSIRSRSRGSRSSERTSLRNRGSANRSRSREYRSRRSRDRRSRSRDRRSRSRDRRSRSRDRSSRSRDRRSRSRDRRSRSRDRRNRNGRSSRSRSRDVSRLSRDRYSIEQRRRADDRYRGQRSRSKNRRSQSADKYSGSSKHNRPKSHSKSRSKSRSRSRRSSVSSSSSSRSRSSSKSSRSKSRSPVKPVLKSYRRESLSSNSDSDSESEIKKTPTSQNSKPSSYKEGMPKPIGVFGKSASSSQKLTPQEKLKRRMQLALSKQYKADKKAEIQKQEKLEQEKLDREEELRQRTLEMRRKEREKRHQDMDEGYSDEGSSRGSSPPRQRRETKSPPRKLGREEDKRKIRRSRSRSRSRTPERRKPTYR